ncbi:MAG: hypothetical protein HY796_04320, partial [Elusimicrobia bacterium]|nr:hypothetical protein [Elusimicrobiota bacterium]
MRGQENFHPNIIGQRRLYSAGYFVRSYAKSEFLKAFRSGFVGGKHVRLFLCPFKRRLIFHFNGVAGTGRIAGPKARVEVVPAQAFRFKRHPAYRRRLPEKRLRPGIRAQKTTG